MKAAGIAGDDVTGATPVSIPAQWNEYERPTRFVLLQVAALQQYFTLVAALDPYLVVRPLPSLSTSIRTRYVQDLPWTKWMGANPMLDRERVSYLLVPLEARDMQLKVEAHNKGYVYDGLIGETTLDVDQLPSCIGELVSVPLEPVGALMLRIAAISRSTSP